MVFNTECETCTRPIFTNPGSMEAGEYRLTRGTCFVVCFGCDRISHFVVFFFERTRPAASMRPPCLIYLSTSILRGLFPVNSLALRTHHAHFLRPVPSLHIYQFDLRCSRNYRLGRSSVLIVDRGCRGGGCPCDSSSMHTIFDRG